jgi:outer membrane protein assembly factor BamB
MVINMRRIPAVALVAALVASWIAAMPSAHATTAGTQGGWRQTNANANANPYNPDESILTSKTIRNIAPLATVNTIKPAPVNACASYSQTSPLLGGNHVFDIGGGAINEFDADSGHRVLHINLLAPDTITWVNLALHDGIIVASGIDCDSYSDPNGYIVAYRLSTGAQLWRFSRPGVISVGESDGVVVGAGGTVGSGDEIAAVDLHTGATLWDDIVGCFVGRTIVASGLVVSGDCANGNNGPGPEGLDAYDLHTGDSVWHHVGAWGPRFATSDTIAHAQIYAVKARKQGPVAIFDATDGTRIRRVGTADKPLVADASRVYTTCGSLGRHLCAFDQSTGAKDWVIHYVSTPKGQGASSATATVAGDVLYLNDGRAIDAATGAKLTRFWSAPADAKAPVVGRGVAVVPDSNPIAGFQVFGLIS